MESTDHPEKEAPSQEAKEAIEWIPLDPLPEALGFIETDELREVRAQAVEALRSGPRKEAVALIDTYDRIGTEELDKQAEIEKQASGGKSIVLRPQLGLSIRLALIRRDAGRMNGYYDALETAIQQADPQTEDAIFELLEAAQEQALRFAEEG